MCVEGKNEGARILKTIVFKPISETQRREWKNEMIDLEYHVNPDNRCAFIYGKGTITMLLFRNTDDMLAEITELESESEQGGMVLDVHFQD